MRPAIGYIRVSTAKQGRSGLGIEAQQEALQRFAEAEGYRFAETFTEVESGKHGEDHRPALAEALERARRERAPIMVAKLDRLSRDVHYISGLMKHRVHRDSGVPMGPVKRVLSRPGPGGLVTLLGLRPPVAA